jgi:hypothetical protein
MSYNDDEELKIGEFEEGVEDDDLDLGNGLDDPLLEDDLLAEDDDELAEDFAGLDGSTE